VKYRAEIDGLRALAVIPIIFHHAGVEYFSGGYIGVDIFFVISGYLITSIIISEMELGEFSLLNFYERRARRILPALYLVMIFSFIFSLFWLMPSYMKDFSQSLVAVSTFSSNVLFWYESGYWEISSELKPLLHTWSLAVEEQYYIIYPFFLMLIWNFNKFWNLSILIFFAAMSLLFAQWGAYNKPVMTFYLLPTRFWELAIGACVAFYFLYQKQIFRTLFKHKFFDEVLGMLGLSMIIIPVFLFDKETPFPSFYALVPTFGTALVILFSSSQTIVGRLLSKRQLVILGLISYGTYLWHWPLIVFSRHLSTTEPSDIIFFALAILSFLVGYLSWRYIEKPFRKKGVLSKKFVFIFSFIGLIIFIFLGFAGQITDGFEEYWLSRQSEGVKATYSILSEAEAE